MIYLLDTNVISETIKPKPNKKVIEWLESIPSHHFALSVISLGEIRKGVEKLQDLSKKTKIIQWLEIDLIASFTGRIIVIDEKVVEKWGYICAKATLPAVDALIAASALTNNLKIVTRNTNDFISIPGLEIINPWELEIN
jgi:predicted nucleic acid-binding protein